MIETVTVDGGDVVDVTVAEGAAGGGVAADADGGEGLELGEVLEDLAFGDVRVEVADVQRRRCDADRRRNRH